MDIRIQDRPEISPEEPDTEKHGMPVQSPPPEIIPESEPVSEPIPDPEPDLAPQNPNDD